MKEILAITFLFTPLAWELFNDRNGDTDKKKDVVIRLIIAAQVALFHGAHSWLKWFAAFNLSLTIHWLLFDYLIHIILYRNGIIVSPAWFNYLGKSSKVDKIVIWKNIGPYGRLFVKLFYFIGSIWLYFKF